jgi:hypothetical protein
MVLPCASQVFAAKVRTATRSCQDLFVEGDIIGGGAFTAALRNHIEKGLRVVMTENAAYTIRNDLNEVREFGIEITRKNQPKDFAGEILTLEEIKNIEVIGKDFFSTYPGVKNVLTKNTINPEINLQEKFEKTFDASNAPNLLLIPDQNTYVWVGNRWLFEVSHGVTENGDLTDHMLAFVLPKKKPKAVDEKVKITNIAPTIAKILGIPKPTCAFEDPLKDVVDALID